MFGIGTSEIVIILVIALLILGPKELPKIARTIGRGIRELQRAKDELRQTMDTGFEEEEESIKPPRSREIKSERERVASAENKSSGAENEARKETAS